MNRRKFLKNICSAATSFYVFGITDLASAQGSLQDLDDKELKDYLHIMENFDTPQSTDIILAPEKLVLLDSTLNRLRRVQRTVGHGNYCSISLDYALKIASNYSSVGSFTKPETDFMEYIFNYEASLYGFYGEKPVKKLTATISDKDLIKIPRTGNYLYRGEPHKKYLKIKKELGRNVYLTSGVRSIMKQFILFLSKVSANKGNLSLASRSLAPPGYSFHAVGDFDVGERGLGAANFSSRFADTSTCARLRELGYLKLRYPRNNLLGVRFEPWHIKV